MPDLRVQLKKNCFASDEAAKFPIAHRLQGVFKELNTLKLPGNSLTLI